MEKKETLFINAEKLEELMFFGTSFIPKINDTHRIQYMKKILKTNVCPIYTHSGTMHADEIFSVALLLLCRITNKNNLLGTTDYITNDDIINSVKRVSNIKDIKDEMDECIVLDLLNGHYDHHHVDPDDRRNYPYPVNSKSGCCPVEFMNPKKPLKCATFGALWSDIGEMFNVSGIGENNMNVYERMFRFIMPMDQQDNYGPDYCSSPISKVISNMNGYSDFENIDGFEPAEDSGLDFKFVGAVKIAYTILRNEILSTQRFVLSIWGIERNESISFNNFGYVEKEPYDIYGLDIKKVGEDEMAPSITPAVINEYRMGNGKHPFLIINHNPDKRDGSLRVVLGKFITLDVDRVKERMGDKIKFIHPNGGFLVTFENEENLQYFLERFKKYIKFNYETLLND